MNTLKIVTIIILSVFAAACNNSTSSTAEKAQNPTPGRTVTGLENLKEMSSADLSQDMHNFIGTDQITLVFTKDVEFEASDFNNKMYVNIFNTDRSSNIHKWCAIYDMQILKNYENGKVTFQVNDKFHFKFADVSRSSSGDYTGVGTDIAATPEIQSQPEIDRPINIQCAKSGFGVKLTPMSFLEFKSLVPNSIKFYKTK